MLATSTSRSVPDEWSAFHNINRRRRAIRNFDGSALGEEDVRAILAEAQLAPSSGNTQCYELHWVRDPAKKQRVAAACNGQRAAATAGELIVVVARIGAGLDALRAMQTYVDASGSLDATSKDYHRRHILKFTRVLRFASLSLWTPLKAVLTALFPIFTLLPVGGAGARHWVARSSIYAAQTLLLAASARGIDSCPMEGFRPFTVAKVLGLPRDAVVTVVIALGRRVAHARVEPRWRRPLSDALVVH